MGRSAHLLRRASLLSLWLCLLWAWTAQAAPPTFSVEAPNTVRVLERELTSEPFTSAVRACFPNSASPFDEFSGEPPPQSQCLVNEEKLEEIVKHLGKSLAQEDSARELERLSQGVSHPQILYDFDCCPGLMATFLSVFYGGNQFRLGNPHEPGELQPHLWITPSPIGRLNSRASNPGPNVILGQSCSETNTQGIEALQLEPDLDKNREATGKLRKLMESRSSTRVNNITDLIVSARILHSGPTAVTGVGEIREQRQWENEASREVVEQTDQTSPGPPHPRTHMLLYYRADWFETLNIKVPDTWDELIFLAEALPRLSGFQGSSRAAGPEDVPNWNLDAWPDVEFTPVEPVEIFQELPLNRSHPQEGAGNDGARYPLCIDLAPNCMGGWLFNAIFASLAQSRGTWQGAFVDPLTTELLGSTEPVLVEEAIRIYSRLTRSAAHQPSSAHSCAAVNFLFASGTCAMTLNWDLFFPYVYNNPVLSGAPTKESSPYVKELVGKVGVAPLPGSTRVYDRESASIVDCDEAACPLATRHTVAEYAVAGREAARSGTQGVDEQQHQQQEAKSSHFSLGSFEAAGVRATNSEALVNRAPYSSDTFADLFFCNQRRDQFGATLPGLNIAALDATSRVINGMFLPPLNLEIIRGKVLEAALEAMGHNVTLQAHKLVAKHDVTGLGGLYQVHPSLATPPQFSSEVLESWWYPNTSEPIPGLSALSGMFLDIEDSRRYFEALWKARYSYRNQAPDLWTTRTLNLAYRHASEELSVYTVASPDFSVEAATKGFQKRCKDARASESESKDIVQAAIWYTTGFNEGMIHTPESKEDRDWLAGAIAGPIVAFVLLVSIALAIFLVIRSKRKRRNWLGQVKAPPAAAETTLLNTDIEGSTQMWETLPETICDRVLSLHNDVIREVLAKYKGYECGTEGDAFLLAFYTASEAVNFATEAQLLLMLAPWPEELLGLDMCRPVFVQPFTTLPTLPVQEKRRSDHMLKSSTRASSTQLCSQGDVLDAMEMGSGEPAVALNTTQSVFPAEKLGDAEDPTLSSLFARLSLKVQTSLEVNSKRRERARTQSTLLSTSEYRKHWSFTLKGLRSRSAQACSEIFSEMERRQIGLSGVLSLDIAVLEASITSLDESRGAASRKSQNLLNTAPSDGIKTNPTDSTVCVELEKPHGTTGTDKSLPQVTGSASANQVMSTSQIPMHGLTVSQKLQASVPVVDGPGEGRLMIMRGLRVRMGVASGVERAEDMTLNATQGRVEYRGKAMERAKAVVNAAQGGQILITPETYRQLPGGSLEGKALVASMGDHELEEGQATSVQQLYQVLPYLLCARAAYLGPVRSLHQLSLGFMSAPTDVATICFMSVAYLDALQLWNPAVANASLDLWRHITHGLLAKKGGYLSEGVGGLNVAAFSRPVAALRWALESLEACLHADWPEELLQTEFGEESSIAQPSCTLTRQDSDIPMNTPMKSHSFSAENESQKSVVMEERLVFRGLRIKVGIDCGSVKADFHPATARIAYRGKVMNRAARIGGVAKSGQVLCSEATWKSAIRELNANDSRARDLDDYKRDSTAKEAIARPIGPHKLKGIPEIINIYQCI